MRVCGGGGQRQGSGSRGWVVVCALSYVYKYNNMYVWYIRICLDIRTFGGGEDPAGIYILHYIYIYKRTNEGRPTGFQQCAQRFNDVSAYIYIYDIM